MTGLDDVGRIYKIFCNRPSGNEPRLITVHELGENRVKADGEALRNCFKAEVLQGDGPKVARSVSARFLGEENDEGFVNSPKVSS